MNLSTLISLIQNNLQGRDNSLRKKSEQQLFNLYFSQSDLIANAYLDILEIPILHEESQLTEQDIQVKQIKKFVMTQLKNCLARHPRPPFKNIWPNLEPQTRERIKLDFFELLKVEKDVSLMRLLGNTLGRLGANLIIKDDSLWPQFKDLIKDLFLCSSSEGIKYAFYILESFYSEEQNNYKDIIPQLFNLLLTGLELREQPEIRLSSLKCFCSYLLVLDHCNHHFYKPLISVSLSMISDMIEREKNVKALYVFCDVLQMEPKFFKSNFSEILMFFIEVFNSKNIRLSEKNLIIQTLCDYSNIYPSVFRNNIKNVSFLLNMIVMKMLEQPMDINQEWMVPQQGFSQLQINDNPNSAILLGIDLINKIISQVGSSKTMPFIQNIIEQLASVQTWKHHYIAVMIIGILGEHFKDIRKTQNYLPSLLSSLSHENPMLRFAGCHSIGLLVQDLRPKFQQYYGVEILQKLTYLFFSQQIPRVVSHVQAALANFIDGIDFHYIQPYFDRICTRLINNIAQGISLVKESAMNTLTALIQIAGKCFEPYFQSVFNIIKSLFSEEGLRRSQLNGVRGSALEAISYASSSLTVEGFLPFLDEFIQILIAIPKLPANHQPSYRQLINSWQRLSFRFGKEMQINIDRFFPQILDTLDEIIAEKAPQEPFLKQKQNYCNNEEDSSDDQKEDKKQKTYRTQMIEISIELCKTLCNFLPSVTSRYLDSVINIFSNILRRYPEESVKQNVCKSLPKIIQCIMQQSKQQQVRKRLISDLIISFQEDRQSYVSPEKLNSIYKILVECSQPIFTLEELHILTDKLMHHLELSQKQKIMYLHEQKGKDQDQITEIQAQIEHEEEIQFQIIQIFGSLFSLYTHNVTYLASQILNSVIIDVLLESNKDTNVKTAVFIIDDIIEHIGFEAMKTQWPKFEEIITIALKNTTNSQVRQAAAYGLGVLAEQTPMEYRNQEASLKWMSLLVDVLEIGKKKKQKLEHYMNARDNVIAAMGKIMRSHENLIDIKIFLELWLIYIPLKHDKTETFEQTNYLLHLIIENPSIILLPEQTRILRLINNLGEIIKEKLYNQTMAEDIYASIDAIFSLEYSRNNLTKIMEQVDQGIKSYLSQFVNKHTKHCLDNQQ